MPGAGGKGQSRKGARRTGSEVSPAAEAIPRDSDAIFRTLAETTAAITFIHRDEKLLYVNRAGTTVTGYTREDLMTRNFWDLLDPSMRDAARSRAAARLRGEPVPARAEVKIVTKSGEGRWVDFTAATIRYEGELAVLGTAFDITDRKRAHKALRDSEKRFRALIEHSSDLVTLTTEDGTIRYVSPNIGRILGYEPEEVIGLNALDLVHPNDVEAATTALVDLLGRPGASATLLYRCRHKDGSWRWMESLGTNVRNELDDGAVIVNKRDVTDRHRAEEESRQHQADLAHVLRVGAVGEMAAGVAHELNQPLAAIVNYAQGSLLRLEQAAAVDEIATALREIASQAIRAGEIVHGLKRFVRKEAPRTEPVDLNLLTENVLRLVEGEARHFGIELHHDLAQPLPPMAGDGVQIEQAIFNLVRNGIEAIRRAGAPGSLSVRTSRRDGGGAELTVADSGEGVPSQYRELVFEPFFTTKRDGLGMGLSITRTIVQAHGGRIWVEPNGARGAVFRVALPAPGQHLAPPAA